MVLLVIDHRVRIRLALGLLAATLVGVSGAPGCSGGGLSSCDDGGLNAWLKGM